MTLLVCFPRGWPGSRGRSVNTCGFFSSRREAAGRAAYLSGVLFLSTLGFIFFPLYRPVRSLYSRPVSPEECRIPRRPDRDTESEGNKRRKVSHLFVFFLSVCCLSQVPGVGLCDRETRRVSVDPLERGVAGTGRFGLSKEAGGRPNVPRCRLWERERRGLARGRSLRLPTAGGAMPAWAKLIAVLRRYLFPLLKLYYIPESSALTIEYTFQHFFFP